MLRHQEAVFFVTVVPTVILLVTDQGTQIQALPAGAGEFALWKSTTQSMELSMPAWASSAATSPPPSVCCDGLGTHLPREPRELSSDRAQEHSGLPDLTHPLPLTHKIIAQVLSLHNMPSKSHSYGALCLKKNPCQSPLPPRKESVQQQWKMCSEQSKVLCLRLPVQAPFRAAWKNYPTVIRTPSGILKVLQNWNWQIALFLFYIQKHCMKECMNAFLCFPVYRMCRSVLISFLEQ